MLCEQVLGKLHDFDTTGKTIEYVDIEWHEAFKKIHKKTIWLMKYLLIE